jgi:hypothetical protein
VGNQLDDAISLASQVGLSCLFFLFPCSIFATAAAAVVAACAACAAAAAAAELCFSLFLLMLFCVCYHATPLTTTHYKHSHHTSTYAPHITATPY